ncbi:hypothetical protein [Streptomyces sp. SM13]|uniref:hypothetical protein n=1 Tax=Streptomyces sp. SM13 TaxID=1983803 RepID=UPI0015E15F0C|nr:hypothetical protein [Streptomyces sp. SM13]
MSSKKVQRHTRYLHASALLIGALWAVRFFNDPNPVVIVLAVATWCCLLGAIWTAPRP